ncbi:DUF3828 domain-containing protein [uncultured Brevundimonas sp.]|uniref:DUF3828 domain-containing protein n=1 Tax=uncultured Brevundimonas sp. TaxID=213418 RepID=UPI00260D2581|nr:DUF3828 domain-containing protein [uncultured Brevundimonas sp.]
MKLYLSGAVLALALGAVACSQPAEPEAPPAPKLIGREAAKAAGEVSPEAFVRALYAVYQNPPAEPVAPGRDELMQRSLNAMIFYDWRNARDAGRKPYLQNDPVCDCTGGEVVLKSVKITEGERNYADADVVFTVDGTEKSQVVKLEKEGGRWKVLDIVKPGEKPLTEQLLAVIEG